MNNGMARSQVQGNQAKVLKLLDEHGESLHRHIGRLTRCEHTTGDLMQELFLKLTDSDGFGSAGNAYAYAWRVATNLALDWRRKGKRRSGKLETLAKTEEQADSMIEGMIQDEQIERALDATARLKEPGRSIIVMRFIEQHSYETMAERLGMKVNHLRSLCSKTLRRLQEVLNAEHRSQEAPRNG